MYAISVNKNELMTIEEQMDENEFMFSLPRWAYTDREYGRYLMRRGRLLRCEGLVEEFVVKENE